MSKRLVIWITIVLLLVFGMSALWFWLETSPSIPATSDKELAENYAKVNGLLAQTNMTTPSVPAPLDLSHPVRLAIGGLGLADNDKNQQLGDLVTVKLTGAPGYQLVERQSLAAILQELNLSLSGFVRARDAVRAGKLLKVDWFLLGTECKINETNSLVVRVVDARTGIMLDAGVFPADEPPDQLASDLATFMRKSRENAASPKLRVFLAIGGFEDVSLNDRQSDFPRQLRGYLTAAYRGSSVTLLEREYVEALLQEVHLDLAGLTEEAGTNPPPAMQSAYWLVSGQYQSYETTNFQVELNLDIQRVFGKSWHRTLRGLPGEPVGRQIKTVIDDIMSQNSGTIFFSRVTEARTQMSIGKELANLGSGDFAWTGLIYSEDYYELNLPDVARRRRNAIEAVRAFETVLLLDHNNREAKIYLAACLRKLSIGRADEARNLYREILEEGVEDKWNSLARQALVESFRWSGPDEKARWFASAIQHNTDSAADQFYRQNAEIAARDLAIVSHDESSAQLAEKRLLEEIQSCKGFLDHKVSTFYGGYGLYDFEQAFASKAAAARAMADFLPKMEAEFPELAPHLAAEVLSFQVDTNSPAVAEYEKTLDWCIAHPAAVYQPTHYWHESASTAFQWLAEHKQFALAVKTMEGWRAAADQKFIDDFSSENQIALGYAYIGVERWQNALDVFESFSNQPVRVTTDGPWGRAHQLILTDKLAARCREKLGLVAARDSRKFDLGQPVLCLCEPSTFAADENGLWVGISGWLLRLDLDLKTNLAVKLPLDESVPVTALCPTSSKIWIGTRGAGLIEFDKASNQCHHLTQADGLLMDDLACLEVVGDSLWIGYGSATGGGLGQLELLSPKLNSFMPSLNTSPSAYADETPPRTGIGKIALGPNGDLWMSSAGVVREFHVTRGTWGTKPKQACQWVSCFSADSDHLAEGGGMTLIEIEVSSKPSRTAPASQVKTTKFTVTAAEEEQLVAGFKTNANYQWISSSSVGRIRPKGVLAIQDLHDQRWWQLEDPDGIPNPPTAMALDGNDLWVGGEGVIALVDLTQCKVRKFCHIKATEVDRIQIAGGYMWAQFDWHLYRIPLSSLQ